VWTVETGGNLGAGKRSPLKARKLPEKYDEKIYSESRKGGKGSSGVLHQRRRLEDGRKRENPVKKGRGHLAVTEREKCQ